MLLISVIIPCYNRANVISKAIESVINQTVNEWELIIVDDGSTENVKEVINPFLKDDRIKYLYQENKGVSTARNYGVNNSQGNFIVFLDSDDFLYQNALSFYYNEITKNPEIHLCFSNYFSENKIKGLNTDNKLFRNFLVSNIPGSFCFNKDFFQSVGGYFDGASFGENFELIIRSVNSPLFNKKTAVINEPLMYYHQWKDSKKILTNKRNKIKSYKLYYSKIDKNSFLSAYYSHQLALNYAGLGYFNDTIKWTIKSLSLTDDKVKYLFKPILIYIKRRIIKY